MIHTNVLLQVNKRADIDIVAGLLKEQARLSGQEPGCLRFEVFHSSADPKLFILVETWASQADLDRHREADAFRTLYVPKVLPLVDRIPHPSTRIWPD
ncbi:MAG: putative quinol monooxygenase [Pseudomonadota bacterium]